jgi:hypothetical protein
VDDYDLQTLALLNSPNEILTVHIGPSPFTSFTPSLQLDPASGMTLAVDSVCQLLKRKNVILEYQI